MPAGRVGWYYVGVRVADGLVAILMSWTGENVATHDAQGVECDILCSRGRLSHILRVFIQVSMLLEMHPSSLPLHAVVTVVTSMQHENQKIIFHGGSGRAYGTRPRGKGVLGV